MKPEMGNPQLAASKSGAHRVHFQLQRRNSGQGDNENRQAFVLTKLLFNGSFQASPVEVSTRLPLNGPMPSWAEPRSQGGLGLCSTLVVWPQGRLALLFAVYDEGGR